MMHLANIDPSDHFVVMDGDENSVKISVQRLNPFLHDSHIERITELPA